MDMLILHRLHTLLEILSLDFARQDFPTLQRVTQQVVKLFFDEFREPPFLFDTTHSSYTLP